MNMQTLALAFMAATAIGGTFGAGLGRLAALEQMGRDARIGRRLRRGRSSRCRIGGRLGGGLLARSLGPLEQVLGDLGHE